MGWGVAVREGRACDGAEGREGAWCTDWASLLPLALWDLLPSDILVFRMSIWGLIFCILARLRLWRTFMAWWQHTVTG